jgi:hypothetical protein
MGALIDPGNLGSAILPFGAGFVVGALVSGPLMEMVGGIIGLGAGGGDDGADANVAYAYHGMHGRHGQGRHPDYRRMMMHRMSAKNRPNRMDLEKGYTNVEQTYNNHLFINDRKSSV